MRGQGFPLLPPLRTAPAGSPAHVPAAVQPGTLAGSFFSRTKCSTSRGAREGISPPPPLRTAPAGSPAHGPAAVQPVN